MKSYNYYVSKDRFNIFKNHCIMHCDNSLEEELNISLKENDELIIINKKNDNERLIYSIVYKDNKGVSIKRKGKENEKGFLSFLNKIWGY